MSMKFKGFQYFGGVLKVGWSRKCILGSIPTKFENFVKNVLRKCVKPFEKNLQITRINLKNHQKTQKVYLVFSHHKYS